MDRNPSSLVLFSLFSVVVAYATVATHGPTPAPTIQQIQPFSYDYAEEAALAETLDLDAPDPDLLREIFAKRRARVLQSISDGAMIVFSVEWV